MRSKPRVVIDTSTLISAALFIGSVPARALAHAVDHCELIGSDATFAEFMSVFGRKKFDAYLSLEARAVFAAELRGVMWRVPVTPQITLCRDPADNKFLDLAMQGGAKHIITGDDDLLALHPFSGIDIFSAQAFCASGA